MKKIREMIQGYKTYIVAFGIAIATVLPAFKIEVPEEAWGILAALGLAAIRAGIQKTKE